LILPTVDVDNIIQKSKSLTIHNSESDFFDIGGVWNSIDWGIRDSTHHTSSTFPITSSIEIQNPKQSKKSEIASQQHKTQTKKTNKNQKHKQYSRTK
jgi:hypothetical protein